MKTILLAVIVSFVLGLFEKHDGCFSPFVKPFVILLIRVANGVVRVGPQRNGESAVEALKECEPIKWYEVT